MNQKVATVALAIAALAVVMIFLFLPGPAAPPSPPTQEAAASPKEAAPSATYSVDFGSGIGAAASKAGGPTAAASLPGGVAWEDRLDQLLTAEADNVTTVRGLVSSMRGLPVEAQEEFIAHAVNLCEDEQYDMVSSIYLDRATPKEVSETIFNDALNRPDEIKLPLLAKTLRNPAHPMNAEAKEILEMYLDLEPGAVPLNGWEQAVTAYIRQQNP